MGQIQICDTGDEAVVKIHKNIKIGIPEIGTFFCYNLQSIVDLKLKFKGYNEKNMGFHLTPKKELLPVSPWGCEYVQHKDQY